MSTKELYDGTFVPEDMPTKNINGLRYLLTQEEIDAKETEDAQNTATRAQETKVKDAKLALEDTDRVAIRCLKAGIAFTQDWQDYVAALRAVVSGGEDPLPEQPDYPEGS